MSSKKSILSHAGCLVLLACCLAIFGMAPPQQDRPPLYDPESDSFQDLQDAVVVAQESGRYILLNVGGNWCGWCYTLDAFIKANDDVRELLEANFVVVRVNMSPENENDEFLSQYPDIHEYPWWFVLDSDGKFLHSQDVYFLEEERSYHKGRMLHFLRYFGPQTPIKIGF